MSDKPASNNTAQLRRLVDRIVRLEEEKSETASAIKDLYTEAKSAGYTARALRLVVKREMEDQEKRNKREAIENEVDVMLAALGDFVSSPLGDFAARKAARAA